MSESRVIVYSKPGTCVQCTAVKRWLDLHKVPYSEENAMDHLEILEETGIKQMPIVKHGNGRFFGGFDINKLQQIAAGS